MCLKSVDVALEWDARDKDYVGYGYKNISKYEFTAAPFHIELRPSSKRWKKATGKNRGMFDTIKSSGKKRYVPGFHIFLNLEDAKNYSGSLLVKVKYKGILAFGKNTNSVSSAGKPCVIAKDMKIVEIIPENPV
jgi:hypothetical protein